MPINYFFFRFNSFSNRNPSLRGQLFSYAILGFAFAEATGLFALMMAFLLLYVA
jgi:F-type H+-transporting ATPase subunit c